jgi:methylenetetrahydrofolate dehydrogenase (NADP+)/methenyltetrahydrofolate cyclohydrolase
MTLLTSKDIVAAIQARQAQEVAELLSTGMPQPKLAIICTLDHPASDVYMRKKKRYGEHLQAAVDIHRVAQDEVPDLLSQLNNDPQVHGIIIQLPLERPEETDVLLHMIAPHKDVDGLGSQAAFEPATPLAILWLLAGYDIDLQDKKVLLIGRGKLVGAPLERMLLEDGVDVAVANSKTLDLRAEALKANVIITATGRPGILAADMVAPGTVVVDAGVAGEGGKTVGDVAPDIYMRDDLTITPAKGGVGPLTVCALFENVIKACKAAHIQADTTGTT